VGVLPEVKITVAMARLKYVLGNYSTSLKRDLGGAEPDSMASDGGQYHFGTEAIVGEEYAILPPNLVSFDRRLKLKALLKF